MSPSSHSHSYLTSQSCSGQLTLTGSVNNFGHPHKNLSFCRAIHRRSCTDLFEGLQILGIVYVSDWQLYPDSGALIKVLSHQPRCLSVGTIKPIINVDFREPHILAWYSKEKSRTDRGWLTNLTRCGMTLCPIYYFHPKPCNTPGEAHHEMYPALGLRWCWQNHVQTLSQHWWEHNQRNHGKIKKRNIFMFYVYMQSCGLTDLSVFTYKNLPRLDAL